MPKNGSDLFWNVFETGGSICIDCVCGRTHFSTSPAAGTWELGELDKLLANSVTEPDRFIRSAYDAVGVITVNGVPICYDCPCGSAAKYEDFLLRCEDSIVAYYRKRAEKKRAELQKADENLGSLVSSIKETA